MIFAMPRRRLAGLLMTPNRPRATYDGANVLLSPGYAVPGWTDEQTWYWLDNATVAAGFG